MFTLFHDCLCGRGGGSLIPALPSPPPTPWFAASISPYFHVPMLVSIVLRTRTCGVKHSRRSEWTWPGARRSELCEWVLGWRPNHGRKGTQRRRVGQLHGSQTLDLLLHNHEGRGFTTRTEHFGSGHISYEFITDRQLYPLFVSLRRWQLLTGPKSNMMCDQYLCYCA